MNAQCHSGIKPPPRENLARFRWHTGAEPTPVAAEESVPILFRDIGPEAMAQFLKSGLKRLAGPMTPITYLRTAEYREPYTDYARIGRLALLQPLEVQPWHSGLEHIFISGASRMPTSDSLGFIPGTLPLPQAAQMVAAVRNCEELREVLGGRDYDHLQKESLAQLEELNCDCSASEQWGIPCRRVFQTGSEDMRQELATELARFGLGESDLCTAWHHLPVERRNLLKAVLPGLCALNCIGKEACHV